MASTIEGGAYRRGDGWVDANGKEIKAPGKAALQKARGTASSAPAPTEDGDEGGSGSGGGTPNPLAGVNFASDVAAEAAAKGGLAVESFAGVTGSGSNGSFTAADVAKLVDAKNAPPA